MAQYSPTFAQHHLAYVGHKDAASVRAGQKCITYEQCFRNNAMLLKYQIDDQSNTRMAKSSVFSFNNKMKMAKTRKPRYKHGHTS